MIGPNVTLSAGMFPDQEMLISPVIEIGNRCVIGRGSHIVGHFCISIGDDLFTGPYVYITDQNHGYKDLSMPIGRQKPVDKEVVIGNGCWLGTGSVILPGSKIGNHVTVAANSVVRGEVPDNCVVAGVPAMVVRYLDEDGDWKSPAN